MIISGRRQHDNINDPSMRATLEFSSGPLNWDVLISPILLRFVCHASGALLVRGIWKQSFMRLRICQGPSPIKDPAYRDWTHIDWHIADWKEFYPDAAEPGGPGAYFL
jgi:hypothetical protein